jgi:surface protein
MATLALPATSVKVFSATVMATLECFTPRLGVTIMVYCISLTLVNEPESMVPVSIDNKGSDVDLTHWDVTHVSNASRAFFNATSFNQDISSWDVSNMTNMSGNIGMLYT